MLVIVDAGSVLTRVEISVEKIVEGGKTLVIVVPEIVVTVVTVEAGGIEFIVLMTRGT